MVRRGIVREQKKKTIAVLILFALLFIVLLFVTDIIEHFSNQGETEVWEAESTPIGRNRYVTFGDMTYRYSDNVKTILLAGTDGRGNQEGEGNSYEGDMADFLELLVVNRTTKSYALLPIDRDTMADVDLMDINGKVVDQQLMQLCIAHAYGGNRTESCENLVNAVSRHLGGLDIDRYYVIPVDAIQRLNHELGGVEVTVQDDFSSMYPEMKKGTRVKLTDEEAQAYTQGRMSVGNGTNEERMARQREYIDAAVEIANQRQAENSKYLLELYEAMGEEADTDITKGQLTNIAYRAKKYDNLGTFTIEGEHMIGVSLDDELEHMEFYADEDSMVEVLTEIYSLVPYERQRSTEE